MTAQPIKFRSRWWRVTSTLHRLTCWTLNQEPWCSRTVSTPVPKTHLASPSTTKPGYVCCSRPVLTIAQVLFYVRFFLKKSPYGVAIEKRNCFPKHFYQTNGRRGFSFGYPIKTIFSNNELESRVNGIICIKLHHHMFKSCFPGELTPSQFPVFTIYVQKSCLPSAADCKAAWSYERVMQHSLDVEPMEVVGDAANKQGCMEACLTRPTCR